MSHSTVLVVIRDVANAQEAEAALEDLLEPFNENSEVTPYFEPTDERSVKNAAEFYREHPEYCPGEPETGEQGPEKPYDEFVTDAETEIEWVRQAVGAYERGGRDDGIYKDGGYGSMCTYNPDSRWDWWTLGGRWHGFFTLKPTVVVGSEPVPEWRQQMGVVGKAEGRKEGALDVVEFDGSQDAILGLAGVFGDPAEENFIGKADLARKGAIDFDRMRNDAVKRATKEYDKFEAATSGLTVADSFQDVRKKVYFDNNEDPDANVPEDFDEEQAKAWHERRTALLDQARVLYREQPWIKALQENDLYSFWGDPTEDFCVYDGGRERYIERARNGAVGTFAVLLDGEWLERGHMGWWGQVGDEKDKDDWDKQQANIIDSLDDNTFLAIVDVHI